MGGLCPAVKQKWLVKKSIFIDLLYDKPGGLQVGSVSTEQMIMGFDSHKGAKFVCMQMYVGSAS